MGLKKSLRRLVSGSLCAAASVVAVIPAAAQDNVRAIGAVIAPPELIATYNCTTWAEFAFLPKAKERARQLIEAGNDKRSTLARLLAQYDRVLGGMCRESTSIFEGNGGRVLDAYARQLPGNKSDITPFLANPRGSRWAKDNAAFLMATAPLLQYYRLTKSVAPELLRSVGVNLDPSTRSEVMDTSVGTSAELERETLILLLTDEGFRGVVPPRFDLASLQLDEVRLRKEAAGLKYATTFGWFNDNASDLVLRHFGSLELMREMGLADLYAKYGSVLEEALLQN